MAAVTSLREADGSVVTTTFPVVGRVSYVRMPETPSRAFSIFPAQDAQSMSGTESVTSEESFSTV